MPELDVSTELPITVNIISLNNHNVLRVVITIWISKKNSE